MDIAAGRYRAACLAEGQLVACLFMGPQLPACDREWLAGLFEKELDESARCALLSGYPPQGGSSAGRIICTCFGVGINTILDVIQVNSLTSLEELFEHMRAGTNCGSCIPELRSLLTRQ
jgi:assimilatory nitrate reductase catalytic subunit